MRVLLAWTAMAVAVGLVLRIALLWAHPVPSPILVALLGLAADLPVLGILVALAGLLLAISGGDSLGRPRWRFALMALGNAGLVFLAFVEWFFFDEFTARFNHIAIDYVLYPHEVVGNIGESYNVPLYLGLAVVAGVAAAWVQERWLRRGDFAPAGPRRWLGAGVALAAGGLAVAAAAAWPRTPLGDRVPDEIAANGLMQLVRAAQSAKVSYHHYYHTLPAAEAEALAKRAFAWDQLDPPVRWPSATQAPGRRPDVVVVLEESLGSEFVGRLGGPSPSTPGLERWAKEGLLLTNLVPTGNRTVRGLEGVLNSFIPLPGDSIWKRDRPEGTASLAGAFAQAGYDTVFCYGGNAVFDGMRPFAMATGWQRIVDDGLLSSAFPRDAFRTAWGVSDEALFEVVLREQRAARSATRPLFATVLTVSNHKPFLTPDSKDPRRNAGAIRKWSWITVVIVVVVALLWWRFGRWVGHWRLAVLAALLGTGHGIFLWVQFQPRDERVNAVRYADKALAGWLDRAKAEGLLDHTIVLVVGDHGARVYGSAEIPVASYRIPGLIISPDPQWRGRTIDRIASQVDLAPTLLAMAGIPVAAPFCGQDLLRLPADGPGRAWVVHNRNLGYLTDTRLVVLGLQRTVHVFRREARDRDAFTAIPEAELTADDRALIATAAAGFQVLEGIHDRRAFRFPDSASRARGP